MKSLIDTMLPWVVELLENPGHDGMAPSMLGVHTLPNDVLVQLASADDRVLVTENASHFAAVTECAVVFIHKSWWLSGSLPIKLASALDGWAKANREPLNRALSRTTLLRSFGGQGHSGTHRTEWASPAAAH